FKRSRKILLENSAHEGGKRGWNLEELGQMIKGVPSRIRDQVGVCIDTAHAYGAGVYDFGDILDIKKFYEDFDREIGLDHLWLFHLNDSMNSTKKADDALFGSHKDRHQNLGLGYIFGGSREYLEKHSQEGGIVWECNRKEALVDFFHRLIPVEFLL
ncbi:MAG: TIM barrel protein, partial [Flavobacteriales bacterium]|nr:TIM barrel protein [Flavobacteriales bacterium]